MACQAPGGHNPAMHPEADPIAWFVRLHAEAAQSESFEPDRAALATASDAGVPSVRFVLVRDVSEQGFVFYTHRDSRKGRELASVAWRRWPTTGLPPACRCAWKAASPRPPTPSATPTLPGARAAARWAPGPLRRARRSPTAQPSRPACKRPTSASPQAPCRAPALGRLPPGPEHHRALVRRRRPPARPLRVHAHRCRLVHAPPRALSSVLRRCSLRRGEAILRKV